MPPKKQKQQPRNAFFHYMLEFKNQPGRKFNSMVEVSEAAGIHWQKMSKEQRRPFEEKANRERNSLRPGGKYTSEGIDVEHLEREEQDENNRKEIMLNNIKTLLIIAQKFDRLEKEMFYIIHVNSFCIHEQSAKWFPAEIAVAGFSLLGGVCKDDDVFHEIVNPGKLPLGYAGIAKLHSEETHQIPPPTADDCESNCQEVFDKLLDFLSSKMTKNNQLPILYAEEKNLPMVTQVLETWCANYKNNIDLLQVYNLQILFRQLRIAAAGEMLDTDYDSFIYREIEKDVYNYTEGIACELHKVSDVYTHCSLSRAIRYGYIICDNCCAHLNIELIPGLHVPVGSKIHRNETVPQKSKSASSRKTSSMQDTIREDSDTGNIISIGKSSKWETGSTASSSVNFGDFDNFPSLSKRNSDARGISDDIWDGFSPIENSSLRSYAGATSLSTGSGFSRRPAALPHTLSHELNSITISPPSMDSKQFPTIGRGRGRGRTMEGRDLPSGARNIIFGKGRGDPFKKPS